MPQVEVRNGVVVQSGCYHPGCEGKNFEVVLAEQFAIKEEFKRLGGVGTVKWDGRAFVEGYYICPWVKCPTCETVFSIAIIVWNPDPVVFAYEPAPC